MTATQRYFDRHARSLERRGVRRHPLRPGPQRAHELAERVVARLDSPTVLDVGCGAGAVGEAVLDRGARRYVGVDLSPAVLAIARRRLEGRAGVSLLEGDFVACDLHETFDVVLCLGVLEYVGDSLTALRWLRARCDSTLLVSFTHWDWVKGPLRHAHYRLHGCALRDHSPAEARALLAAAGFESVELEPVSRRGCLVVAEAQ
jgi:predicted TPR repeat methyltransferase